MRIVLVCIRLKGTRIGDNARLSIVRFMHGGSDMIFSTARVTTQHASRYLTRLSKHWRHRFAVEYTAEQARIPFAADRVCLLQADPDGLSIELEAPDHEAA